jgi:outer membrane protein TolC
VETLFDAGLRSAQTEAAIAVYDQTAANYRQTVLNAFREVEDNLASLRIYAQEASILDSEVRDADKAATVFLNQYKAGTVSYLNVVTAQTAALSAKLSALNIRKERLTAAATLIENLGGGWDVSELDTPSITQGKTTPLSILPPDAHNP